ncbi:hypothetical protein HDU87_001826 [Geranomyces variabilis]|uniref:Uncharacterized protein n=1 Tax=Geranomyces variabilis TaxID=109894 RepID=A0AAD5TPF0_9FUNG|nr:hypothetical protein HDU87_001826 [Geranomyces variabilis]
MSDPSLQPLLGHDRQPRVRQCSRQAKLLLALAVGAAAVGAVALTVVFAQHVFADRSSGEAIMWKPCDSKFLCGTLSVPLDYAVADGERMDIALIKYPHDKGTKSLGSLLLNPGGPGGSGVHFVKTMGHQLWDIVEGRYDIIGFDPRGVGQSHAIRCFPDALTHRAFAASEPSPFGKSKAAFIAHQRVRGMMCAKHAADIAPYVSTAAVARDMDLIREAEGNQFLNYWGFSYGTLLGNTYINMFPDKVGHMVIDGVVDPVVWGEGRFDWLDPRTGTVPSLVHKDQVVAAFAAECEKAGPARCALADKPGSVSARIAALRAKLEKQPISVVDSKVPGIITARTLDDTMFRATYDPEQWPRVAEVLAAADRGDGVPLRNWVEQPPADLCPAQDDAEDWNIQSVLAIVCANTRPDYTGREDELEREMSRVATQHPLGYASAASLQVGCTYWPIRAVETFAGPWNATTKSTVLVLANTLDPVTPVESARIAHSLLGNARIVETEAYGHCSYAQRSSCQEKVVRDFFVDGVAPNEDTTRCAADVPSPFRTAGVSALRAWRTKR